MRKSDVSFNMESVPPDVRGIMDRLFKSGFDVWLVGGAIRDVLLGWEPKDWDVATNATPEQVVGLFRKVVPIGIRHGTVQVHTDRRDVEVTTFPGSGVGGILVDLGRRDFTVNALAVSYPGCELLDPHGGWKDLRSLILRAVGDARSRFREDPLRTLRSGRFASVYGFRIDRSTFHALKDEVEGLDRVARERVREEMFRMIMGERVVEAFEWMRRGGVLPKVLPELLEGYRKKRNARSRHDNYRHTIHTVQCSPLRLRVRLAALFHDIGKPRVRRREGNAYLFPRHAEASARMAFDVMSEWRASNAQTRDVVLLVENHLPEGAARWSDADLRRLISRVGPFLLEDLLDLAHADRLSYTDAEEALRELQVLHSRILAQLDARPPLGVRDLAVDGRDVMRALGLGPGPLVGKILSRLHEEVIENPGMNRYKTLMDFLKKEYHADVLTTSD